MNPNLNHTFASRFTLFDVSTAIRPINASLPLDVFGVTQNHTTEQVTKSHELAENKKLHGPNRQVARYPLAGEQLIRTLNNRHILLRPLTIDPFGQFGPLVYQTLYGTVRTQQLEYFLFQAQALNFKIFLILILIP